MPKTKEQPPAAAPEPTPLSRAIVARARRKQPAPLAPDAIGGTGPHKTKLPHSMLQAWIAAGVTNNAELAMLCRVEAGVSVSRQAILNWRKKYDDGYEVKERLPERDELIPWRVAANREHNNDKRYRFLLAEARFKAHARDPSVRLPGAPDTYRHAEVLREMQAQGDVVIYYDQVNGWQYMPRRPGVDLGYIRDPRFFADGTPNTDRSRWQ